MDATSVEIECINRLCEKRIHQVALHGGFIWFARSYGDPDCNLGHAMVVGSPKLWIRTDSDMTWRWVTGRFTLAQCMGMLSLTTTLYQAQWVVGMLQAECMQEEGEISLSTPALSSLENRRPAEGREVDSN